ncbi:MAG TPA: biopolymer transporter ExbD [Opitutaceae bacterium]
MITRPFNFEAHLSAPSTRFESVPFINVGVLGLFFVLLSSRFVIAPGILLDLPMVDGLPRDIAAASRVLTLSESQGAEMLIFEGRMCTLESFEKLLTGREEEFKSEVLLVRADGDVSLQLLARVWKLSVQAGFNRILLAAEAKSAADGAFP